MVKSRGDASLPWTIGPVIGLERVKKIHQVGHGPGWTCPSFQQRNRPLLARVRFELDQDVSLTMARAMKRLGMPIAVFLGVGLIGLVATSWLLNREALRSAVEAQIRAVTGLDLVVKGSTDISLFPGSYVSFHDVGLKGGAAAA